MIFSTEDLWRMMMVFSGLHGAEVGSCCEKKQVQRHISAYTLTCALPRLALHAGQGLALVSRAREAGGVD